MTIVTTLQHDRLRAKFGANHSLAELIELDHRNGYIYQVLKHGDDFAQDCSECASDLARKEKVQEREQLMRNDLLGETIVVRSRGYKTMRKATVGVYEHRRPAAPDDDGYQLIFTWEGEERGQDIKKFARVDVIIEGERVNVWDDGEGDLPQWEQGKNSNSAKPCERTYEELIQNS